MQENCGIVCGEAGPEHANRQLELNGVLMSAAMRNYSSSDALR